MGITRQREVGELDAGVGVALDEAGRLLRQVGDVVPPQPVAVDASVERREQPCEPLEERALAGAVRSDPGR